MADNDTPVDDFVKSCFGAVILLVAIAGGALGSAAVVAKVVIEKHLLLPF